MWRRLAIASLSAVLIAACSSSNDAQVIPPEISVLPLEIPEARPQSLDVFSVVIRLNVSNRSSEELVLNRLDLSSIGTGAFTIAPSTHRYNFNIPPGRVARVEAWVQLTAEERIGGPEGDIIVRGVAFFRSPSSTAFRRVFTQKMAVRPGRRPGF